MKKLLPVAFGIMMVCSALVVSSCKTAMELLMTPTERMLEAGNYNGLIQFSETALQSRSLDPQEAWGYCEALFHLRRYDDFFTCEETYKPVLPAYYHARLLAYRTTAQIELDNLDAAVMEGERARTRGRQGQAAWQQDFGHNAHTIYLDTLGPLALAYALDGRREEAEQVIAEMVKYLDDFFVSSVGYAVDVGKVLIVFGEYEKARDILSKGGRSLGFDQEEVPRQVMLAKAEVETGAMEEGYRRLQALLDHPFLAAESNLKRTILSELGRLDANRGADEDAIRFLSEAIEITEVQRSSLSDEASKIGFATDKQVDYAEIVNVLLKSGKAGMALEYAERAKARALVDLLAVRKDLGSQSPTSASLLAQLDALESESVRLAATQQSTDQSRGRALRDIKAQLMEFAPELASLVTVQGQTAGEIQAMLAPDEALLEYFSYEDRLFAFVVTAQSIDSFTLEGQDMAARVRLLRRALASYETTRYEIPARQLYDTLIGPLADKIIGFDRLTVVPHGPLHYLPFAALRGDDGFLVESFDLRILPSASVLQFLDKSTTADQGLLAFGNPDTGDASDNLPGAESETRAIDLDWRKSRVLLRELASESNFKKFSSAFRYVHVASHGVFDTDDPLHSRLLLAPDERDDGNLTVNEIYDLTLNADLVTLSACETGLGSIESGDDVIGFTRGFLYAGAEAIVASLWPVSDDATAHLMTRFYSNLKTMPKAKALRQAMLDTKRIYPHPYFWSSFNLFGAA